MRNPLKMNGPKSTTAYALIKDNEYAGFIVANWSNNPNGSVCTALVQIDGKSGIGKAGGYGYCKLSAAVYDALKSMNIEPQVVKPGNGRHEQEFEDMGYTVLLVV
jgi:hypothetical protein